MILEGHFYIHVTNIMILSVTKFARIIIKSFGSFVYFQRLKNYVLLEFLLLVKMRPYYHVMLCLHCAYSFPLYPSCALEKRPHFACSGLLSESLWEVVVLPQGRSCSTLVIVCYITAITVEERENVSGWCLKVRSRLCFERRSVMVKMMAGYIKFQRYHTSPIYRTAQLRLLHKYVLFIWAFKTKFYSLTFFSI